MAAFPPRDREQFDAHWAKIRLDDAKVSRIILVDGLAGVRDRTERTLPPDRCGGRLGTDGDGVR